MTTTDTFRFVLNGKPVEAEAPRDMPLMYVLRDRLDHKATRFGCGDAACGACTVIVDGVARTSCDLPVSAVAGARVETAEGLAGDADGVGDHPILVALLDHQAGQCGYCLPGIAMAAKALLDRGGPVSRADIAEALDGNLCRCGSHGRILRALEEVATSLRGQGS